MGPRVYPSQQDTNLNAKGSLIISIDAAIDYIQIFINNVLVNTEYSTLTGLYSVSLNVNDVVRISSINAFVFNLSKKDYTTDDNNGDNGIKESLITNTTIADFEYTFTATTITSSYNFEYLFDCRFSIPSPLLPSGSLFWYDPADIRSYPSSGSVLYDISGNNRHAIINTGITWVSGSNAYFQLDGNDNNSITGTTFNQTFTSWSMFIAVYLDEFQHNDGLMFSVSGSGNGNGLKTNDQYFPSFFQETNLVYNNGTENNNFNVFPISTGSWWFIQGGVSSNTFTLSNFNGGQPQFSNSLKPSGSSTFNAPMMLGEDKTIGQDRTLKGRIGTAIMWNRTLDNSEFIALDDYYKTRYGLVPTPTPTPGPTKNMTIKCQFDQNVIAYNGANATFNKYFTGVIVDVAPYDQFYSPPLSPNEIIFSSGFTSTGVLTMIPSTAIIDQFNRTTRAGQNYLLCYTGLTSDSYVDYVSVGIEVYIDNVLVDITNIPQIREMVQCGVPDSYYIWYSDYFDNLYGNEMLVKFTDNIEISGPITAQFAPEVSGKTYTCFSAPTYTFAANGNNLSGITRVQSSIITSIPNNAFFYLSRGGQLRRYRRVGAENYAFAVDPVEVCQTSTPTPTPTATPLPTPTATPPPPTPTPTATPVPDLPTIITSGLTIYVDGSGSSYSGTGNQWFNRVTGTTITGATLSGSPTWSTSENGFFTFDGINDTGNFGQASTGTTTGSTSFGGWIKMTTSSTREVIYQRGFSTLWSLQIYKETDNRLGFAAVLNNSFVDCPSTGSTITSGTWYYVFGKWTSNSTLQIYINGVLNNTVSGTGTLRNNGTQGWYLANESGDFDVCSIGDFEVYNRALSNAEVTSNFNAKKALYGY